MKRDKAMELRKPKLTELQRAYILRRCAMGFGRRMFRTQSDAEYLRLLITYDRYMAASRRWDVFIETELQGSSSSEHQSKVQEID